MLAILLLIPAVPGCVSVASDVRDYYRQMAQNYHAEMEKAKIDALTIEGKTKLLATTGDSHRLRRAEHALDRTKAWEAKCAKQEDRFEKAAQWTEERFHLNQSTRVKGTPRPAAEEDNAATAEKFAMPPLFDGKDL
jgi:hypothetical protein